ncbi:aldehyde dehydrogenase family protein [Microbacterium sp. 1P10UB]|uniref:aldehyde dehydrogenase family protein n=1 Tax=unclassified Microbacterium TaxID=2609290 RepID=UPI0039A28564
MTGDLKTNTLRVNELLTGPWGLLIDGELVPAADGRTFDVISPQSEEVVAEVPDGTADDVDGAVRAAVRAHPAWAALSPNERADYVIRLAELIQLHKSDLALLDAVDGGAPIAVMEADVDHSARVCRYFAGLALETKGYSVPLATGTHFTVREPFGVVAAIVPFNHPILFAVTKLAAPLVAGNCVILKPAEATPLSALHLARLVADLFPRGVVQIVVGDGPTVPRALTRHPEISRIAFTGSETTGRAILRDAADSGVKEVSLELGGKNAMLAYPDADPQEVAAAAVRGMNFAWSGQSCGSTSRLLVHESIADAVTESIGALLEGRRIGSPLDPHSQQGPLVNRRQFERVSDFIEEAVAGGADLISGGSNRPAALETGYYLPPTVLEVADRTARVLNEEIFGPVLSVVRWGDSDDPVAMANSVRYGLTASVYSNDIKTAMRAAKKLQAGYVWVNGAAQHFIGMPFGGYKASGLGREESIDELLSFTQVKSIHILDA